MSDMPNIILFNPDQWRGDVLGHMGNPAAMTPNVDALVQTDAVSFRQAFCQNPVCTPSRCSFMTGWYPHTRGHRTMFHMLQPDEPNLLRRLKEAGYFVWWGGKNDLVAAQHGFAEHCDVKYAAPDPPERPLRTDLHKQDDWRGEPDGDNYYSFYYGRIPPHPTQPDDAVGVYDFDWAMVEGAIEFVRNAPANQPFCIYLPLLFPHPPYAVEDPWFSAIDRGLLPPRIDMPDDKSDLPVLLQGLYEGQNLQSWDESRWDELRATYYGMCARVDVQLGMLLDALRETGLYEDTAVFFFSDHGDFTGDYGLVEKAQNLFYDCLTRVPFVVKPPANIAVQPGVCDGLVELIDLVATVEELAGLERNYTHYGRSLIPIIRGETTTHRDAVFCQGGRIYGEEQAMEKGPNLNPQSPYWPRIQLQQLEGATHTKATMCRTDRYKYVHRLYEEDQLYDLQTDPQELHNQINNPVYADVHQQLKDRTMQFYLETADYVPMQPDKRE